MPELVVVGLEMVDIAEDQAQIPSVTARSVNFLVELLVEIATIEQTRSVHPGMPYPSASLSSGCSSV